jgi:hypothetical protein
MKTKVIISLLLICNLANGQTKHDFLVGGSLGYTYKDDNSSLTTSNFLQSQEHLVQLSPAAGYFITNWLVAGVGIEYQYDYTKFDNYVYYNSKETSFAIAPFVRLYAPFGLFIHAEFDFGNSKMIFKGNPIAGGTGFIDPSLNYTYKNTIGYSAGIGYIIKLKDFIGIEPSLRYFGGKFKETKPENSFNRQGVLMNIGLVYFIK